jgi:hypothetical protein
MRSAEEQEHDRAAWEVGRTEKLPRTGNEVKGTLLTSNGGLLVLLKVVVHKSEN